MAFPMSKGTISERWRNVSGEDKISIGLSADLVNRLDSTHLDFYIENQDNLSIEETSSGEIQYTLKGVELVAEYFLTTPKKVGVKGLVSMIRGKTTLNENEFDDFINIINSIRKGSPDYSNGIYLGSD
jgi:hypothetical protein